MADQPFAVVKDLRPLRPSRDREHAVRLAQYAGGLIELMQLLCQHLAAVLRLEQRDRLLVMDGDEEPAAGLKQAVEASDVKRVVLQGDKGVQLGDVVYILDEARAAGAAEVAIAATRRE